MRTRCGSSCTSGSSMMNEEAFNCRGTASNPPHAIVRMQLPSGTSASATQVCLPPTMGVPESLYPSYVNRGSLASNTSIASKPSSAFTSIAGLIAAESAKESYPQRVQARLSSWCFSCRSNDENLLWLNRCQKCLCIIFNCIAFLILFPCCVSYLLSFVFIIVFLFLCV